MEIVVLIPRCQGSDLFCVGRLNRGSRMVSQLDDGVGAVGGHAVVREQGVQERAEQAALGGRWC